MNASTFDVPSRTLDAMASHPGNPFIDHPASVGETYGEHFAVAMGISRQLAGAAAAAFVHALGPRFHVTPASDRIRAVAGCLERHDRNGLRRGAPLETTAA